MIDRQAIYNSLEKNVTRLTKSNKVFREFFEKYVLLELPVRVLLELQGTKEETVRYFPIGSRELQNDDLIIQVIKVLALTEVCNTWTEFEELIMKRKKSIIVAPEGSSEQNAFDKLLKGIMQVPKQEETKASGTKKSKKKKGD